MLSSRTPARSSRKPACGKSLTSASTRPMSTRKVDRICALFPVRAPANSSSASQGLMTSTQTSKEPQMKLLLVFLLLVSCAHVRGKFYTVTPCVNVIESEFPISQPAVDFDFGLARDILDARRICPREQFCTAFTGVRIHVRTGYSWYTNTSRGPVLAIGTSAEQDRAEQYRQRLAARAAPSPGSGDFN